MDELGKVDFQGKLKLSDITFEDDNLKKLSEKVIKQKACLLFMLSCSFMNAVKFS